MTSGAKQGPDEDMTTWVDRIELVIDRTAGCCVDQVAVIKQTDSTQDAAAGMYSTGAGLILLTGEQRSGRGRIGRRWVTGTQGLALTIAVPDTGESSEWLSLMVGLAMYRACYGPMGEHQSRLRVKVPNDLVVLGVNGEGRRKLGGVLVERRNGLLLIGIGLNVWQGAEDWSKALRESAVSFAELGCAVSRIELAERLIVAVTEVWSMDQAAAELELGEVLVRSR